jgi:23S rRNA pseudouridine1911/1915/1917 synthase
MCCKYTLYFQRKNQWIGELDESDTLKQQILEAIVPENMAGDRIDQVMAHLFSDFSRSRITDWIKLGKATVDGKSCKPKQRVCGGEMLQLSVIVESKTEAVPQNIPLDVVYDDEHLIVINKPAGLVVHPAAGNHDGTLLNGLLYHYPELENLPRAGIVHRLDKDTTGLMVIARSEKAHKSLVEQLQERTMGREYQAIVSGVMTGGGCIDEPIGRHPTARTKMAVHHLGKPAVTHYRVAARFTAHTLLDVKLETGRTHQIRVHLSYIHYPLVGDRVYAGRTRIPAGVSEELKQIIRLFPRQALHARQLTLIHPQTGDEHNWQVPMPEDMKQLLTALQKEEQSH